MTQDTISGVGCISELVRIIPERECQRLLVVHGSSSFRATGASKTIDSIRNCAVSHFAEVSANPDIETVARCADAIARSDPDIVLAVGGGSAIDTAKSALALKAGTSLDEVLAGSFSIGAKEPRVWAVPTTAGSGSEATHFAVLYKGGTKYSIANEALKPSLVFLDPLLTISAPKQVSLASGLDAICQAIESYWSSGSTPESRALAEHSLSLTLGHILKVIEDSGNLEARSAMLAGANLAGQAIDITKTTAAHAMSYGLTSLYGLQHGIAVFAAIRPLIRLMDKKFRFFKTGSGLDSAFEFYGDRFPDAFETFADSIWREIDFSGYQSAFADRSPDAREHLVAGVNIERLFNHPVALSKDDLRELYAEIFGTISIRT